MRLSSILLYVPAARANELLRSLNRLLFSVPQFFLGSRETIFGGLNFPRDSRQYAIFQTVAGGGDGVSLYFMNASRGGDSLLSCPNLTRLRAISEIDNWPEAWLECLLRIGSAPEELAPGFYYGKIQSWLGNDLLADFGNSFSGGTVLVNTKCDGWPHENDCSLAGTGPSSCSSAESRVASIGFTQTGLAASLPSWNYIAETPIGGLPIYSPEIMPGPWWWMDWTVDFAEVCPSRVPDYYDSAGEDGVVGGSQTLPTVTGGPGALFKSQLYTAGSLNGASYFVRDRLAQIREVGVDDDVSAKLYLGRFLTLFPEGFRTTAFFSLAKKH